MSGGKERISIVRHHNVRSLKKKISLDPKLGPSRKNDQYSAAQNLFAENHVLFPKHKNDRSNGHKHRYKNDITNGHKHRYKNDITNGHKLWYKNDITNGHKLWYKNDITNGHKLWYKNDITNGYKHLRNCIASSWWQKKSTWETSYSVHRPFIVAHVRNIPWYTQMMKQGM